MKELFKKFNTIPNCIKSFVGKLETLVKIMFPATSMFQDFQLSFDLDLFKVLLRLTS